MPANAPPVIIRFWHARIGSSGQSSLDVKLARLPSAQQDFYHSLRSTKRRLQYLHSRLLLCTALSQNYQRPTTFWKIEERPQATPAIHNLPTPAHISLSHSYNLVCFALSPLRIGIDAELTKTRNNFREMAKLFMSEKELSLLPKQNSKLLNYFYRLWCAKEALYKAISPNEQSLATLPALAYYSLLTDSSQWHLTQFKLGNYQIATVSDKSAHPPTLFKTFINLEQSLPQNTTRNGGNHSLY